ncbi:MAG: FmdB family zinc ribbon protein [Verrucomicrobiota bacterium]
MPLYVYELLDEEASCRICGGRFELNRPVDRKPLEKCPVCKKAVRKCVTGFSTPTVVKKPSLSEAKAAGFTVLEKRDQGVYEKL